MSLTRGFTVIELIIVIILLGILATTIAPKFMDTQGFEESAYQKEVVNKLRAIQTHAMQQTHLYPDDCHQVVVSTTRMGIPNNGCTRWTDETTTVTIDSRHGTVFSPIINNMFYFDDMGRPQGSCQGGCEISIVGEQTTTVKIESEGYIHAI